MQNNIVEETIKCNGNQEYSHNKTKNCIIVFGGIFCILGTFLQTSQNRAGVAETHLKIWDNNLGQNLGQKFGTNGRTDRRTDRAVYRVALQLKILQIPNDAKV